MEERCRWSFNFSSIWVTRMMMTGYLFLISPCPGTNGRWVHVMSPIKKWIKKSIKDESIWWSFLAHSLVLKIHVSGRLCHGIFRKNKGRQGAGKSVGITFLFGAAMKTISSFMGLFVASRGNRLPRFCTHPPLEFLGIQLDEIKGTYWFVIVDLRCIKYNGLN